MTDCWEHIEVDLAQAVVEQVGETGAESTSALGRRSRPFIQQDEVPACLKGVLKARRMTLNLHRGKCASVLTWR